MKRLLSVLLFLPTSVYACPVCFGRGEDQAGLVSGFLWGITILLGLTFSIVGVLIATVIRIEKSRTLSDAAPVKP